MRPLRILVWTDRFPPQVGGISQVVGPLYRGLVDRGHEVCVITDRGVDTVSRSVHRGVEVIGVPLTSSHRNRDVRAFGMAMKTVVELTGSFDPDVHDLHPSGGLVAVPSSAAGSQPPVRG